MSAQRVLLGHGGGGRLTERLLAEVFLPILDNPALRARMDAAVLAASPRRLAFTTDAHVVTPLFFAGGDIGALSVFGTVNDLAMVGARPCALSAAFILEEGLDIALLRRIVHSMRAAADLVGVPVVAGDTKVVERGRGDQIYITTAGVGLVPDGIELRPARVCAGDHVIVSGDLGRHGAAILAARQDLGLEEIPHSDCAALLPAVDALLASGATVHALRDLTRGGLAAALHEIAATAGVTIELDEHAIPLSAPVQDVCEILGIDALTCACEGRFAAFVAGDPSAALHALASTAIGKGARVIGRVQAGAARDPVRVRTALGTLRILDAPSGEQLPRIC